MDGWISHVVIKKDCCVEYTLSLLFLILLSLSILYYYNIFIHNMYIVHSLGQPAIREFTSENEYYVLPMPQPLESQSFSIFIHHPWNTLLDERIVTLISQEPLRYLAWQRNTSFESA